MMILHVLNAAPSSAAFRECLSVIQAGDALVLMGDGVYAALDGTRARESLRSAGVPIHLLGRDASARGVPLPSGAIAVIDMNGFVTLTEDFPRQLCWY